MNHAEHTARIEALSHSIRYNYRIYMLLREFPERKLGAKMRNGICKRQYARLKALLGPMDLGTSLRLMSQLCMHA